MIVKYVAPVRGKVSASDRVKNLINYIANPIDVDKNEKCYLTFTVNAQGTPDNFLKECQSTCLLAKRGKSVFDHYILSWPENETPSEQEVKEITKFWCANINPNGLGFSGLHVNTENLHLHIALQRYDFFGTNKISNKKENFLYRMHALLAIIEKRYGFAHETNPLVSVKYFKDKWLYSINKKPRSVNTLRPIHPDLLPIVTGVTDISFQKQGNFFYLPEEKYPVLYSTDTFLVVMQWWRKEIVDFLKKENCKIYNINSSKFFKRESEKIPLSEIYISQPLSNKKKNIRRDFEEAIDRTSRAMHRSAREEQAVRYLLDLEYAEEEILFFLKQQSHLEKDRLENLRIQRLIESAKRLINRFREMLYKNIIQPVKKKFNEYIEKMKLEQKKMLLIKTKKKHKSQQNLKSDNSDLKFF